MCRLVVTLYVVGGVPSWRLTAPPTTIYLYVHSQKSAKCNISQGHKNPQKQPTSKILRSRKNRQTFF